MRPISHEEYSHENLGSQFEKELNPYDTRRRITKLVDEFLAPLDLTDKTVIDVGCGLGYFTEALYRKGARQITSLDIGPKLVQATQQRCPMSRGVVGDVFDLTKLFGENAFDLVLSSECIEHTPWPAQAVDQMTRILKPGGYLSLSTPNWLWQPVVRTASRFKLRAFDGLENFVSFGNLRKLVESGHCKVLRHEGIHLFPFQFGLHPLSSWLDEHAQFAARLMINQCILAQKVKE